MLRSALNPDWAKGDGFREVLNPSYKIHLNNSDLMMTGTTLVASMRRPMST